MCLCSSRLAALKDQSLFIIWYTVFRKQYIYSGLQPCCCRKMFGWPLSISKRDARRLYSLLFSLSLQWLIDKCINGLLHITFYQPATHFSKQYKFLLDEYGR